MNKITKITKTLVCATALGGLFATATVAPALFGAQTAQAQEEDKRKFEDRKTRRTPALREKVYKVLGKAQEFADAENWGEALTVLEEGLGSKLDSLNSYEQAQYYNFKGFLYYSQEMFPQAIKNYNTILRLQNIPAAMEDNIVYTLAQLYFVTENYAKSIELMNRWMKYQEKLTAQPLVLVGQAYYSLGSADNVNVAKKVGYYKKGISYIEKAMNLYRANGKEPKENWYLLLRVMHFELKNNDKVIDILKTLVKKWPKKEYWTQLAGMYGEVASDDKNSEKKKKTYELLQLATYETAYRQGFLIKNNELVNMSQLYLYHSTPHRAANVLEKGIKKGVVEKNKKNWEALAQSHINAQNYRDSLGPLLNAAKQSKDGNLYMKLGQVYMQLDEYTQAAKYLGLAQQKGKLKRPDTAAIVQGMAYFNLGKLDDAKKSFEVALKHKRSKKMAKQWISYLDKEKKRLKDVKEYLGG